METTPDGAQTPSAPLFYRFNPAPAAARRNTPPMNSPEPSALTPEELARRCQGGCLDSFEQLVRLYQRHIFNFLRQRTRNEQDAEDLTQETFVKAYRGLHRYRPSLAFAPWLFAIARRCAAGHFRSADHFEELPDESEGGEENPAALLEQKDEQKSLWKLVRMLKPMQAEAVWLRYAEGFSVAETAQIMNTNGVHARVLLHRARSNLSKMLAARGISPSNSFSSGRDNVKAKL